MGSACLNFLILDTISVCSRVVAMVGNGMIINTVMGVFYCTLLRVNAERVLQADSIAVSFVPPLNSLLFPAN